MRDWLLLALAILLSILAAALIGCAPRRAALPAASADALPPPCRYQGADIPEGQYLHVSVLLPQVSDTFRAILKSDARFSFDSLELEGGLQVQLVFGCNV